MQSQHQSNTHLCQIDKIRIHEVQHLDFKSNFEMIPWQTSTCKSTSRCHFCNFRFYRYIIYWDILSSKCSSIAVKILLDIKTIAQFTSKFDADILYINWDIRKSTSVALEVRVSVYRSVAIPIKKKKRSFTS